MGRTVGELEHTLSASELSEWVEFYNEEPFMADRIEVQLARLSAITVSQKSGKAVNVSDFMVTYKKAPEAAVDIEDKVKAIFGGMKDE